MSQFVPNQGEALVGMALAILSGILTALMRGDMVPRRTHERELATRDKIITTLTLERDYHRDLREQMIQDLLDVTDAVVDRATANRLARSTGLRPWGRPPEGEASDE